MKCLTCGYWEATIGDQCESCATSIHRPDHSLRRRLPDPLDYDPTSATSRDAAIDNKPRRTRDRDRVFAALTEAGEQGLTDFELAEVLTNTGPHIGQTSAGKRRLDLERQGLVAKRLVIHIDDEGPTLVPDRRPSPFNSSAGVYVLTHFSQPKEDQ